MISSRSNSFTMTFRTTCNILWVCIWKMYLRTTWTLYLCLCKRVLWAKINKLHWYAISSSNNCITTW